MKRSCLTITVTLLLILVFNLPALAERREVGVTYNNDQANARSQITLTWQFATGDRLFRTWDGRTWTEIPIPAPQQINGQEISVVSDVYVPYYANIYYEVRKQGYAPTDRYTSDSQNFVTIPVYPPLRNVHSDFTKNTDLCAGCHVTHTAEGPKLIKAANNTELCKICHGPGATGSRYSVWDGTQRLKDGSLQPSNGGPVEAGPSVAAWNFKNVTSSHIDSNSGPFPGFDTSTYLSEPFGCTDCHTPHASYNGYRLLTGISNVPVWAWAYNPMGMTKEQIYYEKFDSAYCYNCHALFGKDSGSGHTADPAVDPYTGMRDLFRHTTYNTDVTTWNSGAANPTVPVPLANGSQIFCLTCHYPHGSTVTGQVYSSYDKNMNGQYDDYTTALKRMDNSGICQNCHKK